MTEIQDGDVFLIENYESITELSIILGTDDVLPSVEFISPLPYQIFNINNDLSIQLEFENQEYIEKLELYFEVNGFFSNTIIIPNQVYYNISSSEFETFLDTTIVSDFSENVSVHIEIIDIAGGGVSFHPNGEYSDVVEPLTFSRNTSTIELESGWHLLSPPLGGNHDLEADDMFANPAYDCSNECTYFHLLLKLNSNEKIYSCVIFFLNFLKFVLFESPYLFFLLRQIINFRFYR